MHIIDTLPKMILFDYGHTLLYEPDWNPLRGEEALFKYVKSNKKDLSPQQVNDFADTLFQKMCTARSLGFEVQNRAFQKILFEYLEIELTIPISEAEMIFWDNASFGAVMPNADKLIDCLHSRGIRSGVISNISFSGEALTHRINRLLPGNHFEFIITSSEYVFRKPSRLLFDLALKKAGLNASEVWFCGDNIEADIEGSAQAGIFPVWYDNRIAEKPTHDQEARIPKCNCLHIHEWNEMISILERNTL